MVYLEQYFDVFHDILGRPTLLVFRTCQTKFDLRFHLSKRKWMNNLSV